MKVVINSAPGGFSISKEAAKFMANRGNKQAEAELLDTGEWYGYGYTDGFYCGYKRDDPDLIAAVETLGDKASGKLASLKVVEIPDSVEWCIEEYDGLEWVSEKHRTWS